MINSPTPQLNFRLTNLGGDGFPAENNESYRMLMDQAMSGGPGTASYLQHLTHFANFASYLHKTGQSAYTVSDGPDGSQQAVATDGTTTLHVAVQLNQNLEPQSGLDADVPVRGVATVRLALPDPYNIVKLVQFGVGLAELPPGFILTNQIWQALFKPLLSRLTTYVQSSIESWMETDVGGDIDALGETLETTTAEVAEGVSEETAEVVVEEAVVAELALDLAAAVPALAGLALLMAVPLLISALAKHFVLHLEVNNVTDTDINWSIPYVDEGALTVKPQSSLLPKMGRATDSWGDQTSVSVVYQGTFSSMNKSGFAGIGFVLNFSPVGYTGQDVCAVISIPWLADNSIWLGDPGRSPDWAQIYNNNSTAAGHLAVRHGNQRFYTQCSIDALAGNNDEYHCVIRIQPL